MTTLKKMSLWVFLGPRPVQSSSNMELEQEPKTFSKNSIANLEKYFSQNTIEKKKKKFAKKKRKSQPEYIDYSDDDYDYYDR